MFEELATRAHDMELSISNHGNMNSLALEERKDIKEVKKNNTSKDSVAVNTTFAKISRGGAKAKANRLSGWQKKDVRHSTLNKREQKVYPLPDEGMPNMLDQLLQIKLIKLPKCK